MKTKSQESSLILRTLRDPLKLAIWAYLVLLIFEGALRKWVLPGLSTPLLIVRDPVAIVIYLLAFQRSSRPFTNQYVVILGFIGFVSFTLTMIAGHGDLKVAIFGLRVLLLHFPLIFVIGQFLDREDVVLMGKFILLVAIPMTLLTVAQFNSPQGAYVNRSPGGEIGLGLTGALGRFRPSATFSFITGLVQFFTLAGAFSLSSLVERKYFPLFITLGITGCIVIAVPVSISRTLFLNMIILGFATVYGVSRAGASAKGLTRLAFFGLIGFVIASQFKIFDIGLETFSARWELATEDRGGFEEAILGRFLGLLFDPFRIMWQVPMFGEGIGMGTIVGAKLSTGVTTFLGGEGEWGRHVVEMGSFLGLAIIVFRIYFTIKIGLFCHRQLASKNLLSWLIYTATFILILNGQWGQATTLGFTVFGTGLCLAAGRRVAPKPPPSPKQPTHLQDTRNPAVAGNS